MKLLTFLARRFAWTPHEASAAAGAETPAGGELEDCVVVFVHAEHADEDPGRRASSVRTARELRGSTARSLNASLS